MAKRYQMTDRDGKVLGEITLADGVAAPEINRSLIASRPLQIVEIEATSKKAAAEAEAAAKKAEDDAKKQGGGSK